MPEDTFPEDAEFRAVVYHSYPTSNNRQCRIEDLELYRSITNVIANMLELYCVNYPPTSQNAG